MNKHPSKLTELDSETYKRGQRGEDKGDMYRENESEQVELERELESREDGKKLREKLRGVAITFCFLGAVSVKQKQSSGETSLSFII